LRDVLCKGEGLPRERSSAGDGVAIIPRCVVIGGRWLRGNLPDVLLLGTEVGPGRAVDGAGRHAEAPHHRGTRGAEAANREVTGEPADPAHLLRALARPQVRHAALRLGGKVREVGHGKSLVSPGEAVKSLRNRRVPHYNWRNASSDRAACFRILRKVLVGRVPGCMAT